MKKELQRLGEAIKDTVEFPFQVAYSLMFLAAANKAVAEMTNEKGSFFYEVRKSINERFPNRRDYKSE